VPGMQPNSRASLLHWAKKALTGYQTKCQRWLNRCLGRDCSHGAWPQGETKLAQATKRAPCCSSDVTLPCCYTYPSAASTQFSYISLLSSCSKWSRARAYGLTWRASSDNLECSMLSVQIYEGKTSFGVCCAVRKSILELEGWCGTLLEVPVR
jgi:hypothetical protein